MQCLSIKILGPVAKFLGIHVNKGTSGSYDLDQEEDIVELLRDHELSDANTTRSPIEADLYEVQDADSELLDNNDACKHATIGSFQSLVGSLLWSTRCTRPDVSFAVHKATLQTHRPRVRDWILAKRIARYLKGTIAMKIEMVPERDTGNAPTL
ncbi:unnamed protein product [Peronospora effusa]|nr:unnamed protein product [Peronospora effusa]